MRQNKKLLEFFIDKGTPAWTISQNLSLKLLENAVNCMTNEYGDATETLSTLLILAIMEEQNDATTSDWSVSNLQLWHASNNRAYSDK